MKTKCKKYRIIETSLCYDIPSPDIINIYYREYFGWDVNNWVALVSKFKMDLKNEIYIR